jgi:hypothetical protein
MQMEMAQYFVQKLHIVIQVIARGLNARAKYALGLVCNALSLGRVK